MYLGAAVSAMSRGVSEVDGPKMEKKKWVIDLDVNL